MNISVIGVILYQLESYRPSNVKLFLSLTSHSIGAEESVPSAAEEALRLSFGSGQCKTFTKKGRLESSVVCGVSRRFLGADAHDELGLHQATRNCP